MDSKMNFYKHPNFVYVPCFVMVFIGFFFMQLAFVTSNTIMHIFGGVGIIISALVVFFFERRSQNITGVKT